MKKILAKALIALLALVALAPVARADTCATSLMPVFTNAQANKICTVFGTTNFGVSLLPLTDNTYDLGSAAKQWRSEYLGTNLIFGAASAKVIPGATSLLIRNNADSASNLAITDAGAVTLRNDLINSTAAKGVVLGEASRAATVTTVTTLAAPIYNSISAASGDLEAKVGFGAAANGPVVDYLKTRATSGAATTIVQSGDALGTLKFYGANGTTYDPAASIAAVVDSTPGASSDMPGAVRIATSLDGAATLVNHLVVNNIGSTILSNSQGITSLDSDVTALDAGSPLVVVSNVGGVAENVKLIANAANAAGPTIQSMKTRAASGSLDANTIVASGDVLYKVTGYGADGASYVTGAEISMNVDGTPGSGDMPGNILFKVAADGSTTLVQAAKIGNDLQVTLAGKLTSTATSDIGWSVQSGANTACNTTCTSACVMGWDAGATTIVACTDAAADKCLCAGAS